MKYIFLFKAPPNIVLKVRRVEISCEDALKGRGDGIRAGVGGKCFKNNKRGRGSYSVLESTQHFPENLPTFLRRDISCIFAPYGTFMP